MCLKRLKELNQQDILKKHNIDVNSADNGVFLPNRNNTGTLPGILHNGRHPNEYINMVNSRIKNADRFGKQAVIDELDLIRNTLSKANRNSNWRTILK